MKRLVGLLVAGLLLLGLAPAVLAQDGSGNDDRVLISVNGSIEVPASDTVDVLVVVNGTATVEGTVDVLVVVNGDAVLDGARSQEVVVVNGDATIGAGSVVSGDVGTVNGTATVESGATVEGEVRDLASALATLGIILIPALLLFFIGAALVTVIVALFFAALAARQIRTAEWLISNQPGPSLLFGFLGLFVLPILAVLAIITVIGAPIGLVFLFSVLPTVAYFGWLVAAIWVGDWILARTSSSRQERPYLAAVLGVVVLGAIGIVPVIGPLAGFVASLFGFGSLLLYGWRTFRREPIPVGSAPVGGPAAA